VSRKWKARKIAVSSLLALSALSVALPAGAQGIPAGSAVTAPAPQTQGIPTGGTATAAGVTSTSEADAIKQAEQYRLRRENSLAVNLLLPYTATSNNPDLFRQIGRSQRQLRTPADCLKAVEWFTKGLQIAPNNTNLLGDRADAYDCLGRPYLVQRLNDRQKVVELQEAASPTKTASAGAYADLGGAHSGLIAPGEFVDLERAKSAVEFWSKAIALDNGRLGTRRDRAGVNNSRFRLPGVAASDLGTALEMARSRDQSVVNNARERGITARVFSELGTEGIRSYLYGAQTVSARNNTPAVFAGQLRNEGVDALTKFIEAFEAKERADGRSAAFADSRFGAGSLDIAGAYENRAILYNARNERDKALADYMRRTELEPREPNYWFNLAQQYDRMGNSSGVKNALREYLQLTEGGPNNNAAAARALLTKHGG
jgi:tetratricopeptide (TPR) repeat protein